MAVTAGLSEAVINEILATYNGAENKMLGAMKDKSSAALKGSWQSSKLSDTRTVKNFAKSILTEMGIDVKSKLSTGILAAYFKGVKAAEDDLKAVTRLARDIVPSHIARLISETNNLIDNTSFVILRNIDDSYREVISAVSSGVLIGTETPQQAVQRALNLLADKGITGFVDKIGRKWELSSYVEMATRTATARSALQGHIDRQVDLGEDLMMISSIGTTCPICVNWQGKIISITGKTPGYPTLESAKQAGVFHPNCKHTIMAYAPEITDSAPPPVIDKEKAVEVYNQTQEQRYNERQIRRWKRREAVAMGPAEIKDAQSKIRYWQAVQREHIEETGLRRNYWREQARGAKAKVPAIGGAKGAIVKSVVKPVVKPVVKKTIAKKAPEKVPVISTMDDFDEGSYRRLKAVTSGNYGLKNKEKDIAAHSKHLEMRMTDEQEWAIGRYTSSGYGSMNGHLRTGEGTFYAREIEDLKAALNEAPPVSKNTVFFRHTSFESTKSHLPPEIRDLAESIFYSLDKDVHYDSKVKSAIDRSALRELKKRAKGATYSDLGFSSTSYATDVFQNKDMIEFKYYLPEGYNKGLFVESVSNIQGEMEYIIQAGEEFEIFDIDVLPNEIRVNRYTDEANYIDQLTFKVRPRRK